MHKPIYKNFVLGLIFLLPLLFLINPVHAQENPVLESFKGKILKIKPGTKELFDKEVQLKVYTVELENNEVVEIPEQDRPELEGLEFNIGDGVIVDRTSLAGNQTYVITDFQRTDVLFLLAGIFVLLVVLIARKKGFYSLISLVISYFLIVQVLLNQIMLGSNPLISAILISLLIIPLNYLISHGFNRKSVYAILSTLITIIIVGIFASYIIAAAKLTGMTSDEAGFLLQITNGAINIRDLLLAGVIVGTLGILDDIIISQTSIANELKAAKDSIKFNELFTRTISIGRDHIASLVNTLILVYTSTSLPLLILLKNNTSDLMVTLNREVVMEQVIIMLLTSIALIIAVPISTYIACFFIQKHGAVDDRGKNHIHHT